MQEDQSFYVPPAQFNNQQPSAPPSPYPAYGVVQPTDNSSYPPNYSQIPYGSPNPYANSNPYANTNPYANSTYAASSHHHHQSSSPTTTNDAQSICAIITLIVTLVGCCFCPLCVCGCIAGLVGMSDTNQPDSSRTLFKVSAILGCGCTTLFGILFFVGMLGSLSY